MRNPSHCLCSVFSMVLACSTLHLSSKGDPSSPITWQEPHWENFVSLKMHIASLYGCSWKHVSVPEFVLPAALPVELHALSLSDWMFDNAGAPLLLLSFLFSASWISCSLAWDRKKNGFICTVCLSNNLSPQPPSTSCLTDFLLRQLWTIQAHNYRLFTVVMDCVILWDFLSQ